MHGWQSESTDGPKRGWSCVFGVAAAVAVVNPAPTTSECSAVWCGVVCSCSCRFSVVQCSCSCSSTCSSSCGCSVE